MDNVDEIEKTLIKLGGSNAATKTENLSSTSGKGHSHVSGNGQPKHPLSTKSGETSGTRQGDHNH
jgi:hypothetical protein